MKTCSGCKVEKSVTEFYKGSSRCKQCVSAAYFANPERRATLIAAKRAERAHNPFIDEPYRRANSDRIRAYQTARRARLRATDSEVVLVSVLFERDHGICGICGKPVNPNPRSRRWMPSQDHIIPVSRGGANTYANSRLAHLICNVRRGNRDLPTATPDMAKR